MPSIAEVAAPYNHPSVLRERREVSRLLAGILVRRGRSEDQAWREAEALLPHMPPSSEQPGRSPFKRAAG
jgi:hypothetical protein